MRKRSKGRGYETRNNTDSIGAGTAMIWKRCSLCGGRVPTGQACTCKRQAHNRQGAEGIRKEYHSERWKRARLDVLKAYDYLDIYALYHDNKVMPADRVHHIEPVLKDNNGFYDIYNHFPCSDISHHEIHRRYKEEDAEKVKEELRDYKRRYREGHTKGNALEFV